MNRVIFIIFAWGLFFPMACVQDQENPNPPTNYHREALSLAFQDVYQDSIRPGEACIDTFGIVECFNTMGPTPDESVWNCNKMNVTRDGDTIFLRSSTYTPPDSSWNIQFTCLDSYDKFVLDAQGQGIPVNPDPALQAADVHVRGDTLFFKQTLTFFDRGVTGDNNPNGAEPWLIRYPQYGTLQNVDSLQTELTHYCTQYARCDYPNEEPYYRVSHQEWIYVAADSAGQ